MVFHRKITPHPNVLQVLGVSVEQMMIITEYMDRGCLEDYLKTNNLPHSTLIRISEKISAGVEHLHAIDICHRLVFFNF